uniref:Uncharacterized protein n=1 Tax=Cucumis melo TaxID=3656 RepID=A0A9I9E0D8_CUCME
MVRRSERVLESRIRPMKSNKDDHILIDDTEDEERYEEELENYEPLHSFFSGDENYELTGPNGTQIVVRGKKMSNRM